MTLMTMTFSQVAAAMGISKQALHQRLQRGTLPSNFPKPCICTPGGEKRQGKRIYRRNDIEDWCVWYEQQNKQKEQQRQREEEQRKLEKKRKEEQKRIEKEKREEQRKQRKLCGMTSEEKKRYSREAYRLKRQAGVCVGCGVRDATPGQAYCPACRIKNAVYQAARYKARRAARG